MAGPQAHDTHNKEWTLLNKIKGQMTNRKTLEVISFSYFDFDGRYWGFF